MHTKPENCKTEAINRELQSLNILRDSDNFDLLSLFYFNSLWAFALFFLHLRVYKCDNVVNSVIKRNRSLVFQKCDQNLPG